MRRVINSALVAMSLIACSGPLAPPPQASGSGADTDCSYLLGMSAGAAAEALNSEAVELAWRFEYSDAEQGPIAEEVSDPPDGVVTNVVAGGDGEVVLFVSPEGDPLVDFMPDTLVCPWL